MKKSLVFSLSFIGSIGFATALPLVAFALTGRYFDKILNTSPRYLLVGIVIATVLIYFILRRIIADASEKINKLDD